MAGTERVRVTVLEPGDKVQVQLDQDPPLSWPEGSLYPRFSRTKAPRRAKWMTVRRVVRRPGQRTVEAVIVVDTNGGDWLVRANSMFMCTRQLP